MLCGMRVLRRIEAQPVDADDRPLRPVRISRCGQCAGDAYAEPDALRAAAAAAKEADDPGPL